MKRIFFLKGLFMVLFCSRGMAVSAGSWTQHTAADWGAGSGVNVDLRVKAA